MRILFTFVGGRGHLDPLVPLARAAIAAGHIVACSGQAGMADAARVLGLTFLPSGSSTLSTQRHPMVVPDRARERRAIRVAFAGPIAQSRAAALVEVCGSWRPDVIVCDEVDFGAMVAAERIGIPHASVVVLAAGSFVDAALVAEPLAALRAEHGLAADATTAMLDRHLVLVPVPRSFRDPSVPLPRHATLIRPAILESRPAPASQEGHDPTARPLVYVTLGTIFNLEADDLMTRVVDGVRSLPVDVLATVGPHVDPAEMGAQPSNVRVCSFVAQLEVLPRCAAVVCHGGSGTVVGALSVGVPLVLTPLGADQFDNAARCTELAVGTSHDVLSVTSDEIRSAVADVLADGAMRDRAGAIASEADDLPDAAHAIELISALAR